MPELYIAYGTVAAISTFALLRFAFNITKYAPNTKSNLYLCNAIFSIALCAVMEILFSLHESNVITHPVFCYSTEICYSVASLASAYFWCLCSEIEQNSWFVRTKKRIILTSLPFLFFTVAVLSTPFTHIVFYFTEDGHYVRSLLNNPLVYLTAVYIAKSGICALIKSFQSEHYLKRNLYRTFFYYTLGILIAQIFQIAFGAILPFRIVGAAVVFYLMQEHTFKQNIYIDNLANTNNRTAMERYLKNHFASATERFAYVMIDMDSFKYINDHYGHSTGDKAIELIADAFTRVLPANLFFGRYGGDEFYIVGTVRTSDEIAKAVGAAREILGRLASEAGLDFCPEFSYGVAYKTQEITSIPDLINHADKAMYENKRERKMHRQ